MSDRSIAVIGGGVIGLSVARRAALDGWDVRVHRADDPGASWVAGGMLAPHSEGWPREERLLRLGLASLAMWHGDFTDGLPDSVITARESLVVAVDRADFADLKTVGEWLAASLVGSKPAEWPRITASGIRQALEISDDRAHCALMGEDVLRALAKQVQRVES